MTRVTVHQDLTRKAAVSLRQRFPKLSSLGFIQPSSTQYLQLLQGLTRVCFALSQPGVRGAVIRVDLARTCSSCSCALRCSCRQTSGSVAWMGSRCTQLLNYW